jgi:hypothetical protein
MAVLNQAVSRGVGGKGKSCRVLLRWISLVVLSK